MFFTNRRAEEGAAGTHPAVVLPGLEVNAILPALPTLHMHSLQMREQTRTVISLNRSRPVSAFDHWFDYGFHGRQTDQQILTLLTAVTK